jgi:hypothetical protein
MASFVERLVGAAKLNPHTYEDVEADSTALPQALNVVVLSSLAAGIGAAQLGLLGLVGGILSSLVGWLIWAWLTYMIGTRILPAPQTHATWGQMLRTTGFATAPGILRALGIVPIPLFRGLVFLVAGVWMLAAFVVAVRQALDYDSTWRALGVALLGWIVYAILSVVLLTLATGVGV